MRGCLPSFALGLALVGCDDPLAYPQDIDRMRVLGARVSVNGDSSRAWPEPGEAVSLEWLVAAPEPEPALGWRFEACPGRATSRGTPECAGGVFATASATTLSTAPPRFDFGMPTEASERILVRGLVCHGELVPPGGSLDEASCSSERERVLFDVVVGGAGRANGNPTLSNAAFFLGDQAWPEATPSELSEPSCAAGDPTLSAQSGAKLQLEVELAESDRDAVEDPTGLSPSAEALFLSHFATHGRLSRPLSIIEGDSHELALSVPWRAPRDAAGERVRFYFVLRDGRGGVDWSARTLCLVP